MTLKVITQYILILFVVLMQFSCGNSKSNNDEDILVRVGEKYFTATDLQKAMPVGLESEDSVKFASAYIRQWIYAQVVGEVAVHNIGDLTKIDKMVEDYRNELIMWEYRRLMYENNGYEELSEDSILAYYNNHKSEFKTVHPVVKGIFIKIADDAPNLKNIKKWCKSSKTDDIEKLEKYGTTEAIHYDYFRDKWVDSEQIERRIPHDFGRDLDDFFRNNKHLEISKGGFTYLLHITDYLPSGSTTPFDMAKESIKEVIISKNRLKYDNQLKKNLYEQGVNDGKIEIFCNIEQ